MSIRTQFLGVCIVPSIVLIAGLATMSHAQPVDPPPTWGIDDGVSTSLTFLFNGDVHPPVPELSVGFPGWTGGQMVLTGNTSWIAALNGRSGVIGFGPGANGLGTLELTIGNLRNPSLFKEVFLQYDRLVTGGTGVGHTQGTDPNSQISNIQTAIVQLANGWERVTQTFVITPQPSFEFFRFAITSDPTGGGVGIDNIYVHTHCIPTPSAGLVLALGTLVGMRRRR